MLRRLALAAFVALCVAPHAFAFAEVLWFAQSSDGGVLANLSGSRYYCGPPATGATQAAISGTDVTITTMTYIPECPPPPPGESYAQPPAVYTESVSLGHLPDGTYHVTWLFAGAYPAAFSSTFTLTHGALPAAAPLFTPSASLFLAGMLLILGCAALRR